MIARPLLIALAGLTIGLADAQAAAPAQPAAPAAAAAPAVSSTPQTTTASFGDWVLSCQRVGTAATQQRKICEITQSLTAKGRNAPFTRFALGRIAAGDPIRFTVVLPVNITPATAPKLSFGDKGAGAVSLPWQRCVPNGCFAAAPVDEATIARFRSAADPARITFHDSSDREINLPMSLRGLAQALDGLGKEEAAK